MSLSEKQKTKYFITVRFPFTKNDGAERPNISLFSKTEQCDMRTCLSFTINVDYEFLEKNTDFQITEVEFIYDGISCNLEGEKEEGIGFWLENDELHGYPAPIVRFELNKKVSEQEFCMSIQASEFVLKTSLMTEPHYALDDNGHVHLLSKESTEDWIASLKDEDLFCGKKFSINESKDYYYFSAIDFALAPKK